MSPLFWINFPSIAPWPSQQNVRFFLQTEFCCSVLYSHRTLMTCTVGSSVINSCSHVSTSAVVLDTQWHRIQSNIITSWSSSLLSRPPETKPNPLLWSFPCLSWVQLFIWIHSLQRRSYHGPLSLRIFHCLPKTTAQGSTWMFGWTRKISATMISAPVTSHSFWNATALGLIFLWTLGSSLFPTLWLKWDKSLEYLSFVFNFMTG